MFPFDIQSMDEDDEDEAINQLMLPMSDETRAKLLDVADRLNATLDALVADSMPTNAMLLLTPTLGPPTNPPRPETTVVVHESAGGASSSSFNWSKLAAMAQQAAEGIHTWSSEVERLKTNLTEEKDKNECLKIMFVEEKDNNECLKTNLAEEKDKNGLLKTRRKTNMSALTPCSWRRKTRTSAFNLVFTKRTPSWEVSIR